LGRAIVTNGDFTAYVCDSAAARPSSLITLGKLVEFVHKYTESNIKQRGRTTAHVDINNKSQHIRAQHDASTFDSSEKVNEQHLEK